MFELSKVESLALLNPIRWRIWQPARGPF